MKIYKFKKTRSNICSAILFSLLISMFMAAAPEAEAAGAGAAELSAMSAERDIMALIYLCEEYDVRKGPSLDSGTAATLPVGQTVYIQDASYNAEEEILWVYVSFADGSGMGSGYIERQMLACSDERFLDWEEAHNPAGGVSGGDSSLFALGGVSADVAQFPESYQESLMTLKSRHPQWVFVPMETGLDWNTVIRNELLDGRSLVHKSFPDYTKAGPYDDGSWFYATKGILEYYMDPRNGMTEDRIFQFELLTYNETYHTEAAVESFLQNTFMRSPGKAPGTVMTFAHIFWAIGAEDIRQVSPFHLAARVYQEQGQGTSPLISGTYPGYEGYYNYFNVKASGTTTKQVIENGLKYAKEKGWNNAYYSILGGADLLSANYIRKGQDTLYLQKYNVNPHGGYPLYTHQYMQNISAPTTEGLSIKKLYAKADSLDNSFVFKIPVYRNMPETSCAYPGASTEVLLQIPSGYDKTVWLDGVPYTAENRNGKQVVDPGHSGATNAVVYSRDSKGVPTGMYVWTLSYQSGAYTATAQTKLKNLLSYDGFSIRISGDQGIRLKTGISSSVKNTLIKSGIAGYKLKEYGTLVTDRANLGDTPLLKGGEGVLEGMSYGTDARGQKLDYVYDTVNGRQQFTSVLVGLPREKYNTTYTFRSYAVLEKNGTQSIIYGPTVSHSMVSLAQRVLSSGDYREGTEEYAYLKQILEDAR